MRAKNHDRSEFLTPRNSVYRGWIEKFTTDELVRDTGTGDVTTEALFGRKKKGNVLSANALIVAKATGIVAGLQEVDYFLLKGGADMRPGIGPLRVKFLKRDGEKVRRGDCLLELSGDLRDILRVERVVLNLIGRMSGVATQAESMVRMIKRVAPNVVVTPTRKTLWGLLDKRACSLGGAGTHRLGLYDAILIKDNHLAALDGDIEKALERAYAYVVLRPTLQRLACIEIEVDRPRDAVRAAKWITRKTNGATRSQMVPPLVIMLDNFTPRRVRRTLSILKKKKLRTAVTIEVSGGITRKNFTSFVSTGVDIVSIGALTHSAASFDVSLAMLL